MANTTKGGARIGSGRKEKPAEEKKTTVIFYVKTKHVAAFKAAVKPIAEKFQD